LFRLGKNQEAHHWEYFEKALLSRLKLALQTEGHEFVIKATRLNPFEKKRTGKNEEIEPLKLVS
jgi:hypothetical protein